MQKFDCKAALKLRIPKKDNIMGLSVYRYEVTDCEYGFQQHVNSDGEVCSGLKGGIIDITLAGNPTDELLAWMFDHTKKYDGEITTMDAREETLEQIYFEEARCVDLELYYKAESKAGTETRLKLIAQKFRIGDAYFEELNQ